MLFILLLAAVTVQAQYKDGGLNLDTINEKYYAGERRLDDGVPGPGETTKDTSHATATIVVFKQKKNKRKIIFLKMVAR